MCFGGGSGDAAALARQQQQQQQQLIGQGTADINAAYSQFTPQFYQQRQQAYLNYAAPQYGQQYQNTRNQMLYGLANRGSLRSGAAQEQANQLGIAANQAQQQIGNTAVSQANQLQNQIEGQRASLVSQLAATQDPAQTTQQAIATAGSYAAPSTFAPLGPLFQNFANTYLANQYAQAYQPLYSYYAPYSQPGGSASAGFLPSTSIYTR